MGISNGLGGWPPTKRVGNGFIITVRHLTAERARLYDRLLFPWTVRITGLWILFDAYARTLPRSDTWLPWLMDWGETAIRQGLEIGAHILRTEWDALTLSGWLALIALLFAVKIFKRIPSLYSWPAHSFMSKKAVVTVKPDEIGINGRWFENEAVGQLAVMEHSDAAMHTTRDQIHRQEGGYISGKSFYFQNTFEVVMPYHGQPVVLFSIYGSRRTTDQAAARITLVRELVAQIESAQEAMDEFGPSPSLPSGEAP
jgi:hypothetical protein